MRQNSQTIAPISAGFGIARLTLEAKQDGTALKSLHIGGGDKRLLGLPPLCGELQANGRPRLREDGWRSSGWHLKLSSSLHVHMCAHRHPHRGIYGHM